MPRVRRAHLVAEDSVNHCTWRSHNHSRAFDVPGAREHFLELLARYKGVHAIRIHSYCLMGTHPHVVCTSERGQPAFSAFWKAVNQCFARWYNRELSRHGQVVMERLRSPRIQPDGRHLLTVMRYGDLNPVRAGMVRSPKDWPWSSYRHYALGEDNPLIDDAADYVALGENAAERRKAYRALLALPLSETLRVRRTDLVMACFIGSERWVTRRYEACGLAPPGRRAASRDGPAVVRQAAGQATGAT
jgi:putative transposase